LLLLFPQTALVLGVLTIRYTVRACVGRQKSVRENVPAW
jgi:hypothetical protein